MKSSEVWLVNFSSSVGDEITKTRPAIVVSNDRIGGLDLRIVAPVTDAKRNQRKWHVKVSATSANGLSKESLVDCFQVKCFSTQRFLKKLGTLSTKDMDSVKVCLAEVLDLL